MQHASITLRFDPTLRPLLAPRNRTDLLHVNHDPAASLSHVVESLGVPLTEIGELRINGTTASPSQHPQPGDLIEVLTVPKPQPVPFSPIRFILDVHLGTLARRLRLLGVDTVYYTHRDDPALVQQANEEQRILLTRDRGILYRKNLRAGGHIYASNPDEQLFEVLDRYAPPLAPWTRCLTCNGPLAQVDKDNIADQLPAGTRATYDTFVQCTECRQIYWPGAHHTRLTQIIEAAQKRVAAI